MIHNSMLHFCLLRVSVHPLDNVGSTLWDYTVYAWLKVWWVPTCSIHNLARLTSEKMKCCHSAIQASGSHVNCFALSYASAYVFRSAASSLLLQQNCFLSSSCLYLSVSVLCFLFVFPLLLPFLFVLCCCVFVRNALTVTRPSSCTGGPCRVWPHHGENN